MAAPIVDTGDFVRVTNNGDQPLYWGWNSRRYELLPGKETVVPFEAVVNHMGDPRSTGNVRSVRDDRGIVSFLADRETERRRLDVLYMDPVTGIPSNRYPDVTVRTLDDSDILTVVHDPFGEHSEPVAVTAASQNEMSDRIARLEAQLRAAMEAINGQQAPNTTASRPSPRRRAPSIPGIPQDNLISQLADNEIPEQGEVPPPNPEVKDDTTFDGPGGGDSHDSDIPEA